MTNNQPVNYEFAQNYESTLPCGIDAAVIHKDFEVVNLEHLAEQRSRYRVDFKTPFLPHFVNYVKKHSEDTVNNGGEHDPTIIIQSDLKNNRLGATSYFNLGSSSEPGHGDDRAHLILEHSPEYAALLNLDSNVDKETLVEFLEDWEASWIARDSDKQAIDFNEVLKGLRNLQAKTTRESNSSDTTLRAERSESEIAELKANVGQLPETFVLFSPLFTGLESQNLVVRFKVRWVNSGDTKVPRFSLSIIGLQTAQQRAAENFQAVLATDLKTPNMYIGNLSI